MRFIYKLNIMVFILILSLNVFPQQGQDSLGYKWDKKELDSLKNKWGNIVSIPADTSIKIVPPAYFRPYGKNGFIHQGASASIQILEIDNTPYVMVTKGLTKEYFKTQGVKLLAQEDIKTSDNKNGKMYIVAFKVDDIPFERIMYFTGDYNRTIWINANYPVAARNVLFSVLKNSVLSVQF